MNEDNQTKDKELEMAKNRDFEAHIEALENKMENSIKKAVQESVQAVTSVHQKNQRISKVTTVITVVCSSCSILVSGFTLYKAVYKSGYDAAELEDRLAAIERRLDSVESNIEILQADMKDEKNYLYGAGGVHAQLTDINQVLQITPISLTIQADKSVADVSLEKNEINISQTAFDADTKLGEQTNGREIFAGDVVNEKVLLTYCEDDKEVYFYGQFNDEYHWDGYCVVNAYNMDGSLYGICESNFDDGNRMDYHSIIRVDADSDEWLYSDKTSEEDKITGTNITYEIVNNDVKDFTADTVSVAKIINTDRFIDNNICRVKRIYCGQTIDGIYDDQTDGAYLINYDDDGAVDMLYAGRFHAGKFSDLTGNAIEIVYDDSNGVDKYFCYKGSFENGKRCGAVSTDNYISQNDIIKVLNDKQINCELKWK